MNKTQNSNLHAAKSAKNDEFYTQLGDIENELKYYRDHFKDKTIYLNCDDPRESKFFHFFSYQFEFLGLKKLISTGYKADGHGVKYVYVGDKNGNNIPDLNEIDVIELEGTGGFETEECIELLKEADIVVSNPPFSKFREYVALLVEHDKKFLIVGNNNAITYKTIFPLIKNNQLWLGVTSNKTMEFGLPDHYKKWDRVDENGKKYGKVPAISWFTNLEHYRRKEGIIIWKEFNEKEYPKYDNYDAIEVSKVKDIPVYDGIIGVPLTFLDKWNPDQFEILGSQRWAKGIELEEIYTGNRASVHEDMKTTINGKETYDRIFIRRKEEIIIWKEYNEEDYPKYDNYDAIEVSKVKDIPIYDGVMGVPITYLDRHNPEQFEILGATESEGKGFSNGLWDETSKVAQPLINQNRVYKRLFIRRRK